MQCLTKLVEGGRVDSLEQALSDTEDSRNIESNFVSVIFDLDLEKLLLKEINEPDVSVGGILRFYWCFQVFSDRDRQIARANSSPRTAIPGLEC